MATCKMITNPNRFKQAGVFPGKITYSAFHAIKPEIGKIMIKNILCSPVFKIRFCKKFFCSSVFCIVSGLAFFADGRISKSYGKIQNYYLREILVKKLMKKSLRVMGRLFLLLSCRLLGWLFRFRLLCRCFLCCCHVYSTSYRKGL